MRVVSVGAPLAVLASWNTVATVVWTGSETARPFLHLGLGGRGAKLVVLVLGILVLMNLERTLRVSVGTMRWRM